MTSPADSITVGQKNSLYGRAMMKGRLLDLTLGIDTSTFTILLYKKTVCIEAINSFIALPANFFFRFHFVFQVFCLSLIVF